MVANYGTEKTISFSWLIPSKSQTTKGYTANITVYAKNEKVEKNPQSPPRMIENSILHYKR